MIWPFRRKPKSLPHPRPYPRSIEEMYSQYQHVILINPDHIPWPSKDPFNEIRRWARTNHCGVLVDRVLWDQWNGRWASNGIGGTDHAFFGTNDESVAVWTRMRWG